MSFGKPFFRMFFHRTHVKQKDSFILLHLLIKRLGGYAFHVSSPFVSGYVCRCNDVVHGRRKRRRIRQIQIGQFIYGHPGCNCRRRNVNALGAVAWAYRLHAQNAPRFPIRDKFQQYVLGIGHEVRLIRPRRQCRDGFIP